MQLEATPDLSLLWHPSMEVTLVMREKMLFNRSPEFFHSFSDTILFVSFLHSLLAFQHLLEELSTGSANPLKICCIYLPAVTTSSLIAERWIKRAGKSCERDATVRYSR